jgi:hypothetical protein
MTDHGDTVSFVVEVRLPEDPAQVDAFYERGHLYVDEFEALRSLFRHVVAFVLHDRIDGSIKYEDVELRIRLFEPDETRALRGALSAAHAALNVALNENVLDDSDEPIRIIRGARDRAQRLLVDTEGT